MIVSVVKTNVNVFLKLKKLNPKLSELVMIRFTF